MQVTHLTPPQVAAQYRVDVHRVLGWIKRGDLHAINVGDGTQRPRFRISPEALAQFEARRSATPQPRITRQRRRQSAVKEYF
jgi:hypothetical protein